MSSCLDQGQIGPDLGPNYLQRLSGDDKSRHQQVKLIDKMGEPVHVSRLRL